MILGVILEYLKEIAVGIVIRIFTEKMIKWIDSHILKKKKAKK